MALSSTGVGTDVVFADITATDSRPRILLKRCGFQVDEMSGCQFSGVMAIQTRQSINQVK